MWSNPQETGNLVTFTEEIYNGILPFLCSASSLATKDYQKLFLNTFGRLLLTNRVISYKTPIPKNIQSSALSLLLPVDNIACSFLRICSHLLKKSLMENFIFCADNSSENSHKKDVRYLDKPQVYQHFKSDCGL